MPTLAAMAAAEKTDTSRVVILTLVAQARNSKVGAPNTKPEALSTNLEALSTNLEVLNTSLEDPSTNLEAARITRGEEDNSTAATVEVR